jgi:hypothetical protein
MEYKMNCKMKKLTLALLCIGAVSATQAAQPGGAPVTPLASVARTATTPVAPGTLSAFKATLSEIDTDKPLNFKFEGVGHCEGKLDGGDGTFIHFKGDLPFTTAYTYGTGFSSGETFKDYKPSVTPTGNCKIAGDGPFFAKVRVNNPNTQGISTPQAESNISSTAGVGIKPGKIVVPVPATLTSIALAAKSIPGAPNAPAGMVAGMPTLLTVNGTGICKYRIGYIKQNAPVVAQPSIVKTSSLQSPFPMQSQVVMPVTSAGTYVWTANGIDGCQGNVSVTVAVQ